MVDHPGFLSLNRYNSPIESPKTDHALLYENKSTLLLNKNLSFMLCYTNTLMFTALTLVQKQLRRIPLNVQAISAKNIYQKTTHSTVTF